MTRRVLFMISSLRGGGSERQTLLMLRHLCRDTFAPELYLTERAGDLLASVPDDVPTHSFAASADGGIYFPGRVLRQQVRYLRDLIRQRSIDIIYDRTFHMTMIAGPAAATVGVPRVSTIVSPPERAVPLVETRFVALKRRRLAKAYHQARTVIAVSQQAADSAKRYYGLPAVQVVHNPVDIQQLQQDAHGPIPFDRNQALNIVCVGRMTEEKGHRDLISALEQSESTWPHSIPPLSVWLIGDGPLRSELQQRWQSRSRRHQVYFLGIQKNPAPLIAAADALVLPSHFEGMPNVVLEALALGTPVIATRAGGTMELERDEPTVLWAEPRNPASLAEALNKFVTNREAANRRAVAAQKMIGEFHDVKQTVKVVEALLA